MKNTLALIGLVVVLAIGLGWYFGWYQFSTSPGEDGHRKINVDVNTKKIIEDEQNLQKKVTGAINNQTQQQGTNVVPSVPSPGQEKKGDVQPIRFNDDGSVIINPYPNVVP
jgi:hypothetical protein